MLAVPLALLAPVRGMAPPSGHNAAANTPQAMGFVTLVRVTFASNKRQLTDAAKHMLVHACAWLNTNPGAERLLLDGHTDSIGVIKVNDALSDKHT